MRLIASPTSPFARKIRVMLLEKGLAHVLVNELTNDPANRVAEYNPLGKVPALVTDDGETLIDSAVIAGYLETLGAAPFFLPADARAAVSVRHLEALADGVLDAGILAVMENRRAAGLRSQAFIDKQWGKLERGLAALNAHAAGRQWLHGNAMSLADISAACMLGWIELRYPSFAWRQHYPALATWAAPVLARPAFVATAPQE